jgi:hypothetical protein
MLYFKDNYATYWEHEDKGSYSIVSLSTSRKDKKSGDYKNSNWKFCRFVGEAHEKVKDLNKKDHIRINGGVSWEEYEKDGERAWAKIPAIVVFNFGFPEDKPSGQNPDTPPQMEEESEEALPF